MSRQADHKLLIEASGMSSLAAEEMRWERSREVGEWVSRVGKPCWSRMARSCNPAIIKWRYRGKVAVV